MAYRINNTCKGCGVCAKLCPVFAVSGERGVVHKINEKRCVDCGVCGRVCPAGAVSDSRGEACVPQKRRTWPKPRIDRGACSACGICVEFCTAGALSISEPAFRGDIDAYALLEAPEKCTACALCARYCPLGAVSMEKMEESS